MAMQFVGATNFKKVACAAGGGVEATTMKKPLLRVVFGISCLSSVLSAQGQGSFSGIDDGVGSVFYVNSGTVDHHVSLQVDSFNDQTFLVIIEDANGKEITTVGVQAGEQVPAITVPPGGRLRTSDRPTDTDKLYPSGTYSVS